MFVNNKQLLKKCEFCKSSLSSELPCLRHWKSILGKSSVQLKDAHTIFAHRLQVSGLLLITIKPLSRV